MALAATALVEPGRASAQGEATVRAIDAVSIPLLEWAFDPAETVIAAGGTVTWLATDIQEHTATSADGLFGGTFARNRPFVMTFTNPGVYPYICTPHPWMRGTVTVLAMSPEPGQEEPATLDEAAPPQS